MDDAAWRERYTMQSQGCQDLLDRRRLCFDRLDTGTFQPVDGAPKMLEPAQACSWQRAGQITG
jgi:hypothetical protein